MDEAFCNTAEHGIIVDGWMLARAWYQDRQSDNFFCFGDGCGAFVKCWGAFAYKWTKELHLEDKGTRM